MNYLKSKITDNLITRLKVGKYTRHIVDGNFSNEEHKTRLYYFFIELVHKSIETCTRLEIKDKDSEENADRFYGEMNSWIVDFLKKPFSSTKNNCFPKNIYPGLLTLVSIVWVLDQGKKDYINLYKILKTDPTLLENFYTYPVFGLITNVGKTIFGDIEYNKQDF